MINHLTLSHSFKKRITILNQKKYIAIRTTLLLTNNFIQFL